jgi:hypothetical protein
MPWLPNFGFPVGHMLLVQLNPEVVQVSVILGEKCSCVLWLQVECSKGYGPDGFASSWMALLSRIWYCSVVLTCTYAIAPHWLNAERACWAYRYLHGLPLIRCIR